MDAKKGPSGLRQIWLRIWHRVRTWGAAILGLARSRPQSDPQPATSLDAFVEHHRPAFYRPRRFTPADEWARFATAGFRAAAFRDYEPTLEMVLERRAVVVLGEPGSGKSTIAHAAVAEASVRGWIPAFARLRAYSGSLEEILERPTDNTSASDAARFYILDGFDEIPEEFTQTFVGEISELERRDPRSRFLLTARQAYFAVHEHAFPQRWPVYYLADLAEDDVEAFIEQFQVSREPFMAAIAEGRLFDEASNPFVLESLLKQFKSHGTFGTTRAGAVKFLVDSTLGSRPTSNPTGQRRALRMLSVAMEVYGRNQLTEDQAVQVLRRSLDQSAADAARLLAELTQSILLRTATSYAFQMRSFGEYLAAEELAEIRETDRILDLMRLPESVILGPSWENCASYLVELHKGFREAIVRLQPEWALATSPKLFRPALRTRVIQRLLAMLREQKVFLIHHSTIRPRLIARFASSEIVTEIKTSLTSTDEVVAANALVLLGAVGDDTIADEALSIGLDPGRPTLLRESALVALERSGRSDVVPRLLAIDDWTAPLVTQRVHTAGALMVPAQLADVLRAVARIPDVVVSSVYERIRAFRSADAVETALSSLAGSDISLPRVGYLETLWSDVVRFWRPEWATLVADVISRLNEDDRHDDTKLITSLMKIPDAARAVGQVLLPRLVADGAFRDRLNVNAFRLIDKHDVEALAAEARQSLRSSLRAFGRPDVGALFQDRPVSDEEAQLVAEWQREEKDRVQRRQLLISTAQGSTDGGVVLQSVAGLPKEQRPELDVPQRTVLCAEIERHLLALDLQRQIIWTGENSWRMPRDLRVLLELVDRYECRLSDDRPLVWALTGHEVDPVARYNSRYGLSAGAWRMCP